MTQNRRLNELALFAGAGGGILGGHLLGWRTVCAVERDLYAASVLAARQNDGQLPAFPIWSDVSSFDGKPWRGIVDVISGGFPCQDISSSGKGEGITGERSGLWKEFSRIIGEVRPTYAFVENSPMLTIRGLGTVLRDMAALGYDAEWCVLGADDLGANHHRKRIWILAHANSHKLQSRTHERGGQGEAAGTKELFANSVRKGLQRGGEIQGGKDRGKRRGEFSPSSWWDAEPSLGRVANGVAHRVDRIRAIGNGQVPIVAATAFTILKERFENDAR